MNALSQPTKGIKSADNLEQELSKGVNHLAKVLCPEQYIDGVSIAAIQMSCIWALLEQIKLRDEYIAKCMKELNIPELVNHVVDWEDIEHDEEIDYRKVEVSL